MKASAYLFAMLGLASCVSLRTAAPSSSEERNKAIILQLFDGIRRGDLAVFNALSDSTVVHLASGGTRKSGGTYARLEDACPLCISVNPREVTVELLTAHDDLVTAVSIIRGTQVGRLVGVPPTGRQFVATYINVYRLRNGKIVENWVGADRLSIAQQLGMVLCADTAK